MCYRSVRRVLAISVFVCAAVSAAVATTAHAQTAQAPDFAAFGFPRVTGSVAFTPGTAVTLTAGRQKVDIPPDFLTRPATFELLEGDPATFSTSLTGDAQGQQIVATFAFRVTDNTGRIAAFDKAVKWSITDSAVESTSAVFNVTATTPAKIIKNPVGPGAVQGTTLSHPFTTAAVGWVVLNPASSMPGLPQTGRGSAASDSTPTILFGIAGAITVGILGVGMLLWRRGPRTKRDRV